MGRGGRGERDEEVQVPLLGNGRLEPPRKRSTLFSVCPFILGNELCERLAYYGLATNLITYMTRIMGIDAAAAAISIMIFEGTAYVTPLLGAYLADSFWGRYRTILIFSSIYLVGMVLLTLTSWVPGLTPGHGEDASWAQIGALMGSLGVIALGTGGIKPNVSAFGADQFDEADPQDKAEKESFFNYFYLAINIGSLIACTVIVWVQDSVSWTLGFALPAMAMGSAVMLFLAGSGRYRHVAPTESPMARVVKVVTAALRARLRGTNKQQQQPPESRVPSAIGVTGGSYAGDAYDDRVTGGAPSALQQAPGGGYSYLSAYGRPGSAPGMNRGGNAASKSYRWLEDAITEWADSQGTHPADGGALTTAPGVTGAVTGGGVGGYTRRQVEEVKLVLRLLPIFWTTVVYWTLYGFMGTFFIAQGSLMNNAVSIPWPWGTSSSSAGGRPGDAAGDAAASLGRGGGGHSGGGGGGGGGDSGNGQFVFHIPSATMALFNTGAIILLVPLYDKVIDPLLTRLGRKLTLLRKIGWGMVVCTLAMLYAAAIEAWRLRVYKDTFGSSNGSSISGDAAGYAGDPSPSGGGGAQERVPINILWQAPAYILVGASEVLASVGQLEFFYDQAPDVMRSCSMALQLLSTALGSYLGGGVVAAVQAASTRAGAPWLPKDLNHGHLDYFFYLTAALMAVNSALFVWVAAHYEYKAIEHKVAVIVPSVEDIAAAQQAAAAAAAGVPQPIPGAPGLLSRHLAAAGPATGGPPPPPGGAPGTPPLPGALLPPGLPRPAPAAAGGGAIAIARRRGLVPAGVARRSAAARREAAARGDEEEGEGEEEGQEEEQEVYSRSLAWMPRSPALPAPFR